MNKEYFIQNGVFQGHRHKTIENKTSFKPILIEIDKEDAFKQTKEIHVNSDQTIILFSEKMTTLTTNLTIKNVHILMIIDKYEKVTCLADDRHPTLYGRQLEIVNKTKDCALTITFVETETNFKQMDFEPNSIQRVFLEISFFDEKTFVSERVAKRSL